MQMHNVITKIAKLGAISAVAVLSSMMTDISPASSAGPYASGGKSGKMQIRVGFSLWKPGKIYDEAMAGIRDGLTIEKFNYEAIVLRANKDKKKAAENLRKLDAMGLDVIYSLSSAGTQIAKRLNLKTPVIATVVNHPASLGIGGAEESTVQLSTSSSNAQSSAGTQLSGTSYYVDAAKQLRLYEQLFGRLKSIGMIYDRNNPAGALAEMPFMKKAAKRTNRRFIGIGVTKKHEIAPAADKLVAQGVALIVIPTNSLVYRNLRPVLDRAFARRIPVVSMNKQGVENGALAALFADTYNLGRQSASIVKKIVKDGVSPHGFGFEFTEDPQIIINLKSAKQLSYQFPAEILGQAAIVLQ